MMTEGDKSPAVQNMADMITDSDIQLVLAIHALQAQLDKRIQEIRQAAENKTTRNET